jgi:hypothetical protein
MSLKRPLDEPVVAEPPVAATAAAAAVDDDEVITVVPSDYGTAAMFGEAETKVLIRLRRELDPMFQANNRKRGVKEVYVTLSDRLHEEGGGEVCALSNIWRRSCGVWSRALGCGFLCACPRHSGVFMFCALRMPL